MKTATPRDPTQDRLDPDVTLDHLERSLIAGRLDRRACVMESPIVYPF